MIELEIETPPETVEKPLPKGYLSVTGYTNRSVKRAWALRKTWRVGRLRCSRCGLAFVGTTSERCQCKVAKRRG